MPDNRTASQAAVQAELPPACSTPPAHAGVMTSSEGALALRSLCAIIRSGLPPMIQEHQHTGEAQRLSQSLACRLFCAMTNLKPPGTIQVDVDWPEWFLAVGR